MWFIILGECSQCNDQGSYEGSLCSWSGWVMVGDNGKRCMYSRSRAVIVQVCKRIETNCPILTIDMCFHSNKLLVFSSPLNIVCKLWCCVQSLFEQVNHGVVCLAMEVIGAYVSWIDISLVANDKCMRYDASPVYSIVNARNTIISVTYWSTCLLIPSGKVLQTAYMKWFAKVVIIVVCVDVGVLSHCCRRNGSHDQDGTSRVSF